MRVMKCICVVTDLLFSLTDWLTSSKELFVCCSLAAVMRVMKCICVVTDLLFRLPAMPCLPD